MYAYRNNLYWTEVPPPPEVSTEVGKRTVYYGFFCLWYGEEDINPTDTVSVLPISPIVHLQQTIEEEEKMDVVGTGNTVSSAVNLMGEFNTDRSSTAYFSSTATSSSNSSSTCFMNTPPTTATTTTTTTTTSGNAINTPTQVLNTLSTGVPIETATTTTRINTPSPTILKPADPVLTAYFANMINIPISSLVPVLRNSLLPLDEERTNNKYINGVKTYDLYRSFMIALVQFAEWDYPERDSYLWPDFILPIMKSSITREKFFHTAVEHPLNTNNYRQLSDIMLFLLCAQHSGLLEEWNDNAFNSSIGLPQCSDNIAELLKSIDVFKASKEKVFRPFCRAGEAYQVSPTSLPNCCTTPPPQLQQQHKGDSKHSIDFSAKEIKKLGIDLDSYLGEVHLLREKSLVPGQLNEAPLDLSSFMKCWEMRVKELQMENLPTTVTAKQRYQMRAQLDDFLAISRRRNRCLTSLCTVQEVVSVVAPVVVPPVVVPPVVAKSSTDSVSIDSGIKVIGSAVESTGKLTVLSLPAAPMSCPLQCDRPPSVTSVAVIPSTTTATAATTVPTTAPTTSTITSTTVVDATCAPPQTTSAFIPIKEIPSVPKKDVSPPTPAPSRWVVVTYGGGQTLRVPVHFCRISTVPDDIALEVLHRHHGDVKAALKHIATMLTVSSSRNSSNCSAPTTSSTTTSKPHHNDEHSIHSSTTTSKSTAVHNTHTCSPTTATTTARSLKLDMKTNRIVISTEDLCAFHSLANR